MIDPSFVDITDEELAQGNPFIAPYPPTVKELEERLNNLQIIHDKNLESLEFTRDRIQKFSAQINSFEGALKNNEWDFDYETLSDLAGYFDIELNREYDVTLTVRFSGTVTAPMNFDMDDIENFLDIRIDTDYRTSDAIIDLYQDDFEIDYTEA